LSSKDDPAWGWFPAGRDSEDPLESVPELENQSELLYVSAPLLSLADADTTASDIEKASSGIFS
jgi:hypothetical protein